MKTYVPTLHMYLERIVAALWEKSTIAFPRLSHAEMMELH